MKSIQLEITINQVDFSYRDIFDLAKKINMQGVNYISRMKDLLLDPHDLVKLSEEYKIPVTSIHEPLYLIPYTPEVLFNRMLSLSNLFPKANIYVLHLSSVINYLQQSPAKVVKLDKLAKKHNLTLAVESSTMFSILKYYPKITFDPDIFAQFCIQNNLKITLDTSHIAVCGGNIVDFYKKYSEHIEMIHLSDYSQHIEHLPLGKGKLPIKELLNELKRTKYSKAICLELEIKNKYEKLKYLEESVKIVRKYLQ